jgi:hypothetical protein
MSALEKRRSSKVDIEINAGKIDVHFTGITSRRNTGAKMLLKYGRVQYCRNGNNAPVGVNMLRFGLKSVSPSAMLGLSLRHFWHPPS